MSTRLTEVLAELAKYEPHEYEYRTLLLNHAPALIAAARRAAALERVVDGARQYRDADPMVRGECYRELCDRLAALDAAGKEVQGAE